MQRGWATIVLALHLLVSLATAGHGKGTAQSYAPALTLLEASAQGDTAELKKLLAYARADTRVHDYHRRTSLHLAARAGHLESVRLLLAFHADAAAREARGRTALHFAAAAGHADLVRTLLQNWAPAETEDEEGARPLHLAAQSGNLEVVAALLDATNAARFAGAAALDRRGRTPLHVAAAQGRNTQALRLLIVRRAGIDDEDSTGCSPLCLAASSPSTSGQLGAAKLLLAFRAAINKQDAGGRTPLHWAAAMKRPALVKVFLAAGANPELLDAEGMSPATWGAAAAAGSKAASNALPGPPPRATRRPAAAQELLVAAPRDERSRAATMAATGATGEELRARPHRAKDTMKMAQQIKAPLFERRPRSGG